MTVAAMAGVRVGREWKTTEGAGFLTMGFKVAQEGNLSLTRNSVIILFTLMKGRL